LTLGQPAFQESAGIDSGGGVTLKEDVIPRRAVVLSPEEVVESYLVKAGGGCVSRDVAADPVGVLVGPRHHHSRVPAYQPANASFKLLVAREPRFLFGRDRIDIGGLDQLGNAGVKHSGALEDLPQDKLRALVTLVFYQLVERVNPFLGFIR